jgi:hypothetical protein
MFGVPLRRRQLRVGVMSRSGHDTRLWSILRPFASRQQIERTQGRAQTIRCSHFRSVWGKVFALRAFVVSFARPVIANLRSYACRDPVAAGINLFGNNANVLPDG